MFNTIETYLFLQKTGFVPSQFIKKFFIDMHDAIYMKRGPCYDWIIRFYDQINMNNIQDIKFYFAHFWLNTKRKLKNCIRNKPIQILSLFGKHIDEIDFFFEKPPRSNPDSKIYSSF